MDPDGIRREFVHLAYLDDSGSDALSPVAVFGGVVIPDTDFASIEARVGWVIEKLIPEERREKFEEFHAAELYWGHGAFQGIPEPDRHDAIRRLLEILEAYDLPFFYSAVSKQRLASGPFASAHCLDVTFRLCALGIENWLYTQGTPMTNPIMAGVKATTPTLCLFILDDSDDKKLKDILRRSFRSLRLKRKDSSAEYHRRTRLWHIHDDMYFGDSREAMGIQIADICNYFMMRHLKGEDDGEFFARLRPHAVCAKPEPEFSQCRQWLLCHNVT